jgi:hypothetical protein
LVVLFLWLKVALGIFLNQPITLAVESANRHCSALLVLRKGACLAFIELPHYQGSGLTRFWFGASGGQASIQVVIWFRKPGQHLSSLPSKSTNCAKT